jgi:malonyl-ACP decarboxylase
VSEGVMVTGLGVVSPIGLDVESFARSLRAGAVGVEELPVEGGRGEQGLLAPLHDFDFEAALAAIPGIGRSLREHVHRVGRRGALPIQAGLAAVAQAWVDARLQDSPVPGHRIGVIVGGNNLTGRYSFHHHETYQREPMYLPARYALDVKDTNHVATVSEAFGVTGEGYTVGASMASGNAAIIHAARLVQCGAVDVCLAVGAMAQMDPQERAAFGKLGLLAEAGDGDGGSGSGSGEPDDDGGDDGAVNLPRPFDRDRSGFAPGEATACLVLESRRTARRRRTRPLVELAGFAQGLDANSQADPDPAGETRVMTTALEGAGVDGDRVDYVNAHATATTAGDAAELSALRRVLDGNRPWINSTKSMVGHTLTAAGALEAVATVVQMTHGFVHPNPTLLKPIDDRFRLVGRRAVDTSITCALSNSFSFGGFNSSLVMIRE